MRKVPLSPPVRAPTAPADTSSTSGLVMNWRPSRAGTVSTRPWMPKNAQPTSRATPLLSLPASSTTLTSPWARKEPSKARMAASPARFRGLVSSLTMATPRPIRPATRPAPKKARKVKGSRARSTKSPYGWRGGAGSAVRRSALEERPPIVIGRRQLVDDVAAVGLGRDGEQQPVTEVRARPGHGGLSDHRRVAGIGLPDLDHLDPEDG